MDGKEMKHTLTLLAFRRTTRSVNPLISDKGGLQRHPGTAEGWPTLCLEKSHRAGGFEDTIFVNRVKAKRDVYREERAKEGGIGRRCDVTEGVDAKLDVLRKLKKM